MKNNIETSILRIINDKKDISSNAIFEVLSKTQKTSLPTVKRYLTKLVELGEVSRSGQGKNTRYSINPSYEMFVPIDYATYFKNDIDDRNIKSEFNWNLIRNIIPKSKIFSDQEEENLSNLQKIFIDNLKTITLTEYRKSSERMAIDLSWKSSQIEGNTYSLLETERLLNEKKTAEGKTREEATMLINHKEAIEYILNNKDDYKKINKKKIEDIHRLLIQDLDVDYNIRKRKVGITGTNYSPLDNEFQITEALDNMCEIINDREDIFEKMILCLVLISYIQPFIDGNKRTARIMSNSLLLAYDHCPISFRTVESIEYKKAMLLFYEQNNISFIKDIVMDQYEFAVKTYY